MITEEQASKIIELLTKIESNTKWINRNVDDLSFIRTEVEEIKELLLDKKSK